LKLDFHSISESKPGKKWLNLFQKHWPSYKEWILSGESEDSPDLKTCQEMLRTHMPEFYPTYLEFCALVGSDALAHRF